MALLLAASTAVAGTIVGSVHDFSGAGWSGGAICTPCHNQGNSANSLVPGMGQWNHQINMGQSYMLYSSTTLKSAAVTEIGIRSKLCLSCHDGTIAVDSFSGRTGSQFITSANNIGTNLKNDHPIGMVYDQTLAGQNPTLFNPVSAQVTIGAADMAITDSINNLLLYDGKMECVSCHDVHNNFTVGTTGLLLMSTSGNGSICTACHNK